MMRIDIEKFVITYRSLWGRVAENIFLIQKKENATVWIFFERLSQFDSAYDKILGYIL
jgi:hypothetical protein